MLRPQDFPAFFAALHDYEPFPWQTRLAEEVAAYGWPGQIAAPTGCGKTSAVDIAVFEVARQAATNMPRSAPLRIFSIIDRCIAVDSTFEHARAIARQLNSAEDGILRTVADALRSIGGENTPLVVARLRGGTWQDDCWIRSPVQPAVIVSTVDQVGSRLLFRGYGVGTRQRPLHAALVGTDSLFLIDEAHLSQPFLSTVRTVRALAGTAEVSAAPPAVVEMTATPQKTEARRFDLETADYEHPVLSQRLTNSKVARLVRVAVTKHPREDRKRAKLVRVAVRKALVHAGLVKPRKNEQPLGPPAGVVGVVVNRVTTARAIFAALSERDDSDCLLLTGRMRPFERDQLLAGWAARICAGRKETPERPLFVVATQCIEVGADLDFDALVTEVAPLDALRQRFGRLDRLGRRRQSSAVILARSDTVTRGVDDSVYGPALAQTWNWLQKAGGTSKQVDFGITALAMPPAEDLQRLLAPEEAAPRLRSRDLDALACTSVGLAHEPDLPLYLHGRPDNPDVSVVWRADLPDPLNADNLTDAVNIVALVPPTAPEAMPLPLYAVRAWLRGLFRDISDVEGERPAREQGHEWRCAIRWRGDASELITAETLRPGDVIVVPSSYGGCDAYGWNPGSKEPVTDIADGCAWLTHWKPVFRLSRTQVSAELLDDDNPQTISQSTLDTVLATLPACPELLRERSGRGSPVAYPTGTGWLIEARKRIVPLGEETSPLEEANSLLGREVELQSHCRGVAKHVVKMVQRANLPDSVVCAAEVAALLHDLGKVDARFQTWLHCGDEIAASVRVLAKSAMNRRNRHLYEAAREASGLPAGWRHELLSVPLAEQVCEDALTLHLIAAHHGGGRPFHPPVLDLEALDIAEMQYANWTLSLPATERTPDRMAALNDRIAHRFAKLQRQYGWWGLALLETFLILADWRQSAAEQGETQDREVA